MADPLLLTVLAYGHMFSAVGWLGGSLINAFVLGPGLQTISAPARLEFLSRVVPKILRYTAGMIVGTFVFGLLLLYELVGGNFAMLSFSSSFGAAISTGIALAVVTAILALTVIFPSFGRLASIANGVLKSGQQPPPPEMTKYAERARISSMAGTLLLLVILVMMVTAGFY